jgi:hypothetical protein
MIALTKHKIHHKGQDGIAVRLWSDGIEVAAADLCLPADDGAVRETVDELRTQAEFSGIRINGRRAIELANMIETGAVE